MTAIPVAAAGGLERALRILARQTEGLVKEARRRRAYASKGELRRLKARQARLRRLRQQRRQAAAESRRAR